MSPVETPSRDTLGEAGVTRLVVVAPNWLGDAVMALPALADVYRASPGTHITVAARPSVAPMFTMVRGVSEVLSFDPRGPWWRDMAAPLRARAFDGALLLPNSFHSAFVVTRAGIRERWGYATDLRGPLLTRRAAPPVRLHQAAYYQRLTQALGFASGPLEPRLDVGEAAQATASGVLREAGWDGRAPFVAIAPGAAYGRAKRWPAASFAAAALQLSRDGLLTVLIGSAADAPAGDEVTRALGSRAKPVNIIGRTDLPTLGGVLRQSRGIITNDSGAMHLAAALGVCVTAPFGPTDERATRPLGRAPVAILTHDVWCRPCMLRDCPLGHACMRGVTPDAVSRAARDMAIESANPS